MIELDKSIQYLKGVGEARAKKLEKMNILSIRDLVEHFPRNYEDRTKLKTISEFVNNESAVFKAKIIGRINNRRIRKSLNIIYFYVTDETSEAQITIFNQNFMMDKLEVGKEYAFYGKTEFINGRFEIQNPVITEVENINSLLCIYPIYSLTNGITNNYIYSLVKNILKEKRKFPDVFSDDFIKEHKLLSRDKALRQIHIPNSFDIIESARRRIIFEELYLLQLALSILKRGTIENNNGILFENIDYTELKESLPFELTCGQQKAVNDILLDMHSKKVMNRLIEGDVGSGKTMVAEIAMFVAFKNGYQSALMAPTSILATQHFEEIKERFFKFGVKCELLVGSTTAKKKKEILSKLQSGEIDIIIGTHSLIEDKVIFNNLGLVITDEQHRFGVRQRMALGNKGKNIDTIVMTATPIPRTLALMLYSDLDMTIIDELPPGRKPVKTYLVNETFDERVNKFIEKHVEAGNQVYIVCPLIEDNEELSLTSAKTLYEKYKSVIFPKYNVGFLNGKMKEKEKDEVMEKFKNGEISIIVSTTVIEVGVNVPNATLMVIEDADRFGLATLHQLRGRVGRSSKESFCILKTKNTSKDTKERLEALVKSNNGFKIAEEDLKLRGPGDFFGTRQHGLPEFKMADLLKDIKLLEETSKAAKNTLLNDPMLQNEENKKVKLMLNQIYKDQLTNIGT